MMKSNEQRKAWVDGTRGIAIILVVLGHVIHIVERQLSIALPTLDVVDRILYSFHVPLFFFLSGMFFFKPTETINSKTLLWSRAKRLLYPYLLWSLIQTTLEVVSQAGWQDRLAPELLQIAYFPQAHFWFLYVLFFSGAIGILLRTILKSRLRTAWALLVVSLIWHGLHPWLPSGPIKDLGIYLPYFALGSLSSELYRNKIQIHNDWISSIAMSGLFICSALLAISADLETSLWLRLPIGILGVTATLMTSFNIYASLKCSWMAYIGQHSMAIYLLHVLAIQAVFILVLPTSYPLAICMAMVAGIGGPLIFKAICNKLHLTKLMGLK